MKTLVRNFCRCEAGAVASAEVVLMATLVCLGLIAGLSTWRDQVLIEFADAADAVSELDQSYSYSGITIAGVGSIAGSTMVDGADHCEAGSSEGEQADQNANGGAQCVVLTIAPMGE